MGTEISEDDVANILNLCDQVIALSEYRAQVRALTPGWRAGWRAGSVHGGARLRTAACMARNELMLGPHLTRSLTSDSPSPPSSPQLYDYLKSRMMAVAPNLTVLVGELVGARLIAHVGSLVNLAKAPASTIQILGAEKALFR